MLQCGLEENIRMAKNRTILTHKVYINMTKISFFDRSQASLKMILIAINSASMFLYELMTEMDGISKCLLHL